jgi:hypothetical protein
MKRIHQSSTVKGILRGALAKIKKGWTQGQFSKRTGKGRSYCAVGAMRSCSSNSIKGVDAVIQAKRLLVKANGIRWGIVDWNDQPRRTQADVIAAFKKAITLA